MLVEQRLLRLGGEVAAVRNAAVVGVRPEIVAVLLRVGPGAADAVDLAPAAHLGGGRAKLGGAHGTGEGQEHPPPGIEELPPGLGCLHHGGGVEMAEMALDKLSNWT